MNRKINFTQPYIDNNIIQSVTDCLKTGWITTGPKVSELETLLCTMFNMPRCLCLNSWTNAAKTILNWYGIQENDEIIIPVTTYCATANIVIHCNAKVVMVDIGNDMNIDVDKIRDAITENTKIIMPVDLGGLSCNYEEIFKIINEQNILSKFKPNNDVQKLMNRILILSDAAHSIGAVYKDKFACNYADFTVFSFHAVKNITTAEGGAICFNLPTPFVNSDVYDYFKIFTLHGQTKTAQDKFNGNKKDYWKYDIITAGYKYNMPDLLACIAIEQLKQFNKLIKIRREICKQYYNILKKYTFIKFPLVYTDYDSSSCHLMCIYIEGFNENDRDNLLNELALRNIFMNVHFKPLPLLTVYKNLGYDIITYSLANKIFNKVISLPLHYNLKSDEVRYICDNLIDVIETKNHTQEGN